MLGLELGLTAFKASILPIVLLLQNQRSSIIISMTSEVFYMADVAILMSMKDYPLVISELTL